MARTMEPCPESLDALLGSEVFGQLGEELNGELHARMEERTYEPGEALIRQSEPGDCLMLLLEGTAAARLRDETGERWIADFEAGDVVGEMALLTGESRSADVLAESAVRVLALRVGDFQELAMVRPELGLVLTHLVAERLGKQAIDGLGGKRVDRYRIERCVGRGAMAVVYEAREVDTARRVALKMMSHRLLYEPGANARFRREAEILLGIRHENIARVFHRFSSYRTSFMALELCEGPDLGQVIERHGPIDEGRARPILGQIAAALGHMHSTRIVHRDLKPENVMSTPEGVLKITDFGLAKFTRVSRAQEALTDSRTLLGTPLYMSPELLSGEPACPASDLYAFGCIAHRVLTARPLFTADSFFELVQQKSALVIPPTEGLDVSDEMRDLLARTLARDPARRALDLSAVAAWASPVDPALLV